MKILFLRHAEPDYVHDSITPKGDFEAKFLAELLKKEYPEIKDIYCSPLGRAKKTCSYTEDIFDKKAVILPWLREFDASINRPDDDLKQHVAWDWLPEDMDKHQILYTPNFMEDPILKNSDFKSKFESVVSGFDEILKSHGYERNGSYYKVNEENHDVIAIFSHFGVSTVMISHLMNSSPYPMWIHSVALPSSLTEFISEERRQGKALFRMNRFSSYSHLEINDEKPSFAARFCETYSDDTRHD